MAVNRKADEQRNEAARCIQIEATTDCCELAQVFGEVFYGEHRKDA